MIENKYRNKLCYTTTSQYLIVQEHDYYPTTKVTYWRSTWVGFFLSLWGCFVRYKPTPNSAHGEDWSITPPIHIGKCKFACVILSLFNLWSLKQLWMLQTLLVFELSSDFSLQVTILYTTHTVILSTVTLMLCPIWIHKT